MPFKKANIGNESVVSLSKVREPYRRSINVTVYKQLKEIYDKIDHQLYNLLIITVRLKE